MQTIEQSPQDISDIDVLRDMLVPLLQDHRRPNLLQRFVTVSAYSSTIREQNEMAANPEWALFLIERHTAKRHYSHARRILRVVLAKNPHNTKALEFLGIVNAQQGRRGDAIKALEIAQSIKPDKVNLYDEGIIDLEAGEFEQASEAFENARKLGGDRADEHVGKAIVLDKAGNRRRAVKELEAALSLHRDEALSDSYNAYVRTLNMLYSPLSLSRSLAWFLKYQVRSDHHIEHYDSSASRLELPEDERKERVLEIGE